MAAVGRGGGGCGHLLLQGVPGVAKTLAVVTLAKTIQARFQRIQLTPDLLPADIVGTRIYDLQAGGFKVEKGPVFSNIVLADEINRTPPKTQAALLEAMQEYHVTAAGRTYPLERPFFVLATQNPFEFEGTYPLPENQLDRFMLNIEIGYPDRNTERDVLTTHREGEPVERLQAALSGDDLAALQREARAVRVDPALNDYILDIVAATRKHEELSLGVSTRGAITLYRAVQSLALADKRNYVIPDDVKKLAVPALAHRVTCRGMIREGQRERAQGIIRQILNSTRVPD